MLIHEKTKSVLLKVKHPKQLEVLFPDRHQRLEYKGHNIAIRHGLQEAKILNNLGIKVPSPIMHYYDWPGPFKPWEHQKKTAELLTMHSRAFVLNDAGTAKTASSLWAADFLMHQGAIRKCLIAAKLSTLEVVWMQEIFNFLMHRRAVLLYGSRAKRLKLLESDVDFYVINHDGLEVIQKELIARRDIDLIILDEASDYRNARTAKYKVLQSLLRPDIRFWPLTATPCPDAPTDAWALAKLVNPDSVPKYFTRFREMTMRQITNYKWVPKDEAERIVFDVLQPAVRFAKSDCLDLPPVVVRDRTCEMTTEQTEMFTKMRNQMVLEFSNGEKITAVNAADKITKLRQILCGVVRHPITEDYVPINYAPRLRLLIECIQEARAKVLVVVPFKGIIEDLRKQVSKHYSCAVLNGDVPPKRRTAIIREFKALPDPHVLLCHPKVMAHGLNLTEADALIFYAPIYSNDEVLQVMERINRPGQTRKMTITRLSSHLLERQIYNSLLDKQQRQARILSLYRDFIEM